MVPGFLLIVVENLLQLKCVVNDPTIDGAVVNLETTLLHDFLDIPIAERIHQVPADRLQDHIVVKMSSLEADH